VDRPLRDQRRDPDRGALRALSDHRAVLELIEPSRAEPGSLCYQRTQDPENRRVFFLFEVYEDESAYRAHGGPEHFKRLALETAIPLLESRERAFDETLGELI